MDLHLEQQLCDLSMSLFSYTRDIPLFSQITEDEIDDIEQTIEDNADTYLELNASCMSKPDFMETFVDDLYDEIESEGMHQGWFHNSVPEINDPLQYDPAVYWKQRAERAVHQLMELYNIPPRQIATIHDNKKTIDFDDSSDSDTIVSMPYNPDAELTDIQILSLQMKLEYINQLPVQQQRSREWHEIRHTCFSASNIYKLLGSQSQYNSLIYEKCMPLPEHFESGPPSAPEDTSNARDWGVKYEPLTVKIYEHKYQTTVKTDYGCIPHSDPNLPIGASPDGINVDPNNLVKYGRMVEIKNIVSREITGIPKEEYWIQTQTQMEVCDLDACDFVETRFKEYSCRQAFIDGTEHGDIIPEYRGCSLYLMYYGTETDTHAASMFVHSPVEYTTIEELDNWITTQEAERKSSYVVYNISYWYLHEFSCVLIKRNEVWLTSIVPTVQDAWKTVQQERISGCEHRAPQKRVKTDSDVSSSNLKSTLSPALIATLDTLDDSLQNNNCKKITENGTNDTNDRRVHVQNRTNQTIPTIIVNKTS